MKKIILPICAAAMFFAAALPICAATTVGSSPLVSLNSGLAAYWTLDGKDTPWTSATAATTLDRSGNGNTGTITTMSRAVSPAAGKIGQGLYFDGTDDYVNIAGSGSSFNWQNMTVCVWLKFNSSQTAHGLPFSKHNAGSMNGWSFEANPVSVGVGRVSFQYGTNAQGLTGTFNDDKWHFFCGAVSPGSAIAYSDGKYNIQFTPAVITNSQTVKLGRLDTYGGSYWYAGSIDEPRIYNRTLSAAEVWELYKLGQSKIDSSPLVNLSSGLVGYWTLDGQDTPWTSASAGTTLDRSGKGNTGTLTSLTRAASPAAGKIGQALYFGGANNYVNVPDSNSLDVTSYTASAWIYPTQMIDNAGILTKGMLPSTLYGFALSYFLSGKIGLTSGDSGTGYDTLYSTATVPINKWSHVVGTYDSSTGIGKIYINGVYDSQKALYTPTISTYPLFIGMWRTGYSFKGSIDDARLYNRALSASEIRELYKSGQEKIAVSPVSNLNSGLVSYWTFDGKDVSWTSASAATLSDKSSNNTGTTTTMSRAASPIPGKIGQGLSFDGSDDKIDTSYHLSLSFSSGLTFSAWIKKDSTSQPKAVFRKVVNPSTNEENFGANYYTGNFKPFVVIGGAEKWGSNGAMGTGTWTHAAYTYDGSYIRTYINGVLSGTPVAQTGSIDNGLGFLRIGANQIGAGGENFDGDIDDLRIYNRALSASEIQLLYRFGR